MSSQDDAAQRLSTPSNIEIRAKILPRSLFGAPVIHQ
jgi:hypothetical protein